MAGEVVKATAKDLFLKYAGGPLLFAATGLLGAISASREGRRVRKFQREQLNTQLGARDLSRRSQMGFGLEQLRFGVQDQRQKESALKSHLFSGLSGMMMIHGNPGAKLPTAESVNKTAAELTPFTPAKG